MSTNALHQLLLDDIRHAEQLLNLIDAEYSALQARDLQALEKLLSEKLPLLSLLDQHGQQRSQILIAANCSANAEGLKHYTQHIANGNQVLGTL
ncbi:MAG TPA: flagellar export chaperone FlgN [Pseudomonas sp.]|nr:flagellar export chaperone FlgN [Pseudomonas sp.]